MNPRQPSFGCSAGNSSVTFVCSRRLLALIAPLCPELHAQVESKLNSFKNITLIQPKLRTHSNASGLCGPGWGGWLACFQLPPRTPRKGPPPVRSAGAHADPSRSVTQLVGVQPSAWCDGTAAPAREWVCPRESTGFMLRGPSDEGRRGQRSLPATLQATSRHPTLLRSASRQPVGLGRLRPPSLRWALPPVASESFAA